MSTIYFIASAVMIVDFKLFIHSRFRLYDLNNGATKLIRKHVGEKHYNEMLGRV